MEPLISVIIPVYNTEQYLEPCLRSVLAQTYENMEVLVIDDASPDNSVAIVQAMGDPRIRLLRHAENQGQGAARNTGLDAAKGEYVTFVDSDDLVHPQMLEVLYGCLEKHGADFAYGNKEVKVHSQDGFSPGIFALTPLCQEVARPFDAHVSGRYEVHMGVGAKLHSASLLRGIRYHPGVYYEDVLFSLITLGAVKKSVFVPVDVYFYLQRRGSTMQSGFTLHKARSYLAVVREMHRHFRAEPERLAQIQGRYLNRIFKRCFKGICASPEKGEMLRELGPELRSMYREGIVNYKGLSLVRRWQLWRILQG